VPYVVHATWTYNGLGGKRARLRDMGLWIDPPDYYSKGNFLAIDLQPPEVGWHGCVTVPAAVQMERWRN
jgi:hypothetical protein